MAFFLTMLRKLSTTDVHGDCFPWQKALSAVHSLSITPTGRLNELASSAETDRCDDGGHGWLGQQVCVCVCEARRRETVFYLTSCWSGDDMIQRQTESNLITLRRVMAFAFETGSSYCLSKRKFPPCVTTCQTKSGIYIYIYVHNFC